MRSFKLLTIATFFLTSWVASYEIPDMNALLAVIRAVPAGDTSSNTGVAENSVSTSAPTAMGTPASAAASITSTSGNMTTTMAASSQMATSATSPVAIATQGGSTTATPGASSMAGAPGETPRAQLALYGAALAVAGLVL